MRTFLPINITVIFIVVVSPWDGSSDIYDNVCGDLEQSGALYLIKLDSITIYYGGLRLWRLNGMLMNHKQYSKTKLLFKGIEFDNLNVSKIQKHFSNMCIIVREGIVRIRTLIYIWDIIRNKKRNIDGTKRKKYELWRKKTE